MTKVSGLINFALFMIDTILLFVLYSTTLSPFTIPTFLLLSKRYGYWSSAVGIITSLLISLAVAIQITRYQNLIPSPQPWKKVLQVEKEASELTFHKGEGVFVKSPNGETQIRNLFARCSVRLDSVAGETPSYGNVALTTETDELPLAFGKPISQIYIFASYQKDQTGIISYVLYENGEIWCSEKFTQGGGTGTVQLLGSYVILSYFYFVIFSCVSMSISVGVLELIYRYSKKREGL